MPILTKSRYASAPGVSFGNLNGAQVRHLAAGNTTPTSITRQDSGNRLALSWPADHAGWTLQTQTNSVSTGLGSNWVDVPGSGEVTQRSVPISASNDPVFYRIPHLQAPHNRGFGPLWKDLNTCSGCFDPKCPEGLAADCPLSSQAQFAGR